MSRSRILRLVGYLLAFLAAALKYYPATLLVLALRERLRPFLAVAAAIGALGTLFLLAYGHDVLRTLPHIPAGTPFGDMFGAKNVVFGIYVILRALTVPAGVSVPASLGAGACVVAVAVKLAVCLWRQTEWCTALSRLDPERRWLLLAGALVLSGCFIAEQNVGYRGIFFLLALPGLWDLARDWSVRGWIPYNAAIVVVVLMWERAPRYWIEMMNDKVDLSARVLLIVSAWILREIAYWTIMTLFVVLVLAYVAQSPAVTDFRLWLRRLVCTR